MWIVIGFNLAAVGFAAAMRCRARARAFDPGVGLKMLERNRESQRRAELDLTDGRSAAATYASWMTLPSR